MIRFKSYVGVSGWGPLGMNASMDVSTMTSKIVNAEKQPKQKSIDDARARNVSSIQAYDRLKQSLNAMSSQMISFGRNKAYAARKVDTTNENIVTAQATPNAIAGRYSVNVQQLAQSHKLASPALEEGTKFDAGQLHISMGKSNFSVDIRNHSKLVDVVRSINYAKNNPGVRASMINDVKGQRLVVASNMSGAENAIQMSVETDSADNPLNRLSYQKLEGKVNQIENARAKAQQLLSPLSDSDKEKAQQVAETIRSAAHEVDQKTAGITTSNNSASNNSASNNSASNNDSSPTKASSVGKQQITIPEWGKVASEQKIAHYVTPESALKQLDQQLQSEQKQIDKAVANGTFESPEQAKKAIRDQLPAEQRAHMEQVEAISKELRIAQSSSSLTAESSGMKQIQAAQDAKVILDDVAELSSSTNVIQNAIEGVDLTLGGTSEIGQPTEINISYDRDTVRQNIEQFVNSYNQFRQLATDLTTVDPTTGQQGALANDSIVRNAQSRVKSMLTAHVGSAPHGMQSLTDLGVMSTRQGTLEINDQVLNEKLNSHFTELAEFFSGSNGFVRNVENSIRSITGAAGSISNRERSISDANHKLDTRQATLDRRISLLERRTHSRFSAMKDATNKMQSQLSRMMSSLG